MVGAHHIAAQRRCSGFLNEMMNRSTCNLLKDRLVADIVMFSALNLSTDTDERYSDSVSE